MKKSRYNPRQVAHALRRAGSTTPIADVCRQGGRCAGLGAFHSSHQASRPPEPRHTAPLPRRITTPSQRRRGERGTPGRIYTSL